MSPSCTIQKAHLAGKAHLPGSWPQGTHTPGGHQGLTPSHKEQLTEKNIQRESPWHNIFSTPPTIWMPLKPGELKGRARSYSRAQIRNYLQLEESENVARAFLVTQWIRICLPMLRTWVRSLVWSNSKCPMHHNY